MSRRRVGSASALKINSRSIAGIYDVRGASVHFARDRVPRRAATEGRPYSPSHIARYVERTVGAALRGRPASDSILLIDIASRAEYFTSRSNGYVRDTKSQRLEYNAAKMTLLESINSPADLRTLSPDQLRTVADEIRAYILETMSRVGGHTGASLGAVELAVALHYAFDTPRDRLVWDVGHQAYAHKILTGRRELLPTIKQYGGISGFLRRDESEYDTFGAGHASTSLSAALGMAVARDKQGLDHHVVALIGDASLAGGMAMEAINQAGHLKSRLIVVLNDNEMSIAPAVGALTGYLNRIRGAGSYHRFKDEVEEKLLAIPSVGERLHHAAKTMKDAIAAAVLPGALINELGFKYIGYIDGHNPIALVAALREAQQIKDGPV